MAGTHEGGGAEGNGRAALRKGQRVQYFHEADLTDAGAGYFCPMGAWSGSGPVLRLSHGWLDGTLQEAFEPASCDPERQDTWPLVQPRPGHFFTDRYGAAPKSGSSASAGGMRVHPRSLREPSFEPPLLSLVFVRWNADKGIGVSTEGDGSWGNYGSPPSDMYQAALLEEGVKAHPQLGGAQGDFEVLSLFVKNSKDVADIAPAAPWLRASLQGRKRTLFWMVWPAEWEDTDEKYYAGYIDRRTLFRSMRACEEAGLHSGFPHPADLYELITSKTWMASLCMQPEMRLPAATIVSKGNVVRDAKAAAQQALAALEFIRSRTPFPVGEGEPATLAAVNSAGVKKGIVKLGWSWEARYVAHWTGEEHLQARLVEMTTMAGCSADTVIVQEWVDFDFEMRLYFIPPSDWTSVRPGRLEPVKFECNAWEGYTTDGRPKKFLKYPDDRCLEKWEGDAEALRSAKEQCVEIAQHPLTWLLVMCSEPVPLIRLDFMLRRLGPGKVRVVFGEYCEMGACSLGWKEGPVRTWRAALDSVLRWAA